MKTNQSTELILYKSKDGEIRLDVQLEKETIWLDAHQLAELFGRVKFFFNSLSSSSLRFTRRVPRQTAGLLIPVLHPSYFKVRPQRKHPTYRAISRPPSPCRFTKSFRGSPLTLSTALTTSSKGSNRRHSLSFELSTVLRILAINFVLPMASAFKNLVNMSSSIPCFM